MGQWGVCNNVTCYWEHHLQQPAMHTATEWQCIKDAHSWCMESQPVSPRHVFLPSPLQLLWQWTHCTFLQQSTPSDLGGVPLMMQWGGHLRQWVTGREDNRTSNTATDCLQFMQLKHSHSLCHLTKTPPSVQVPSGCAAPSLLPTNSEGTGWPMSAPKRSTSDRPQGNPPKGQGEGDLNVGMRRKWENCNMQWNAHAWVKTSGKVA